MSFLEQAARHRQAGFSLIELAVAMFVMALLLGGLMVPLRTQVESRRIDETRAILDQARDALLGYVVARGYFPCPASAASNGMEAPVTNHSAGANSCPAEVTGVNVYAGFFPAATLGFAPVDGSGFSRDAWATEQNRLRYAVADANIINGVAEPITNVNGIRNAGMPDIIDSSGLIRICKTGVGVSNSDCAAAADRLADNVMAVIWSLGPNAPTGGTSDQENKNYRAALTGYTRVFVHAERSGSGANTFDDQLTWIGPALVFNRMVSAGTLP
jgi:prepilin-type N-terminal cleavage/methylation domain-containing protein